MAARIRGKGIQYGSVVSSVLFFCDSNKIRLDTAAGSACRTTDYVSVDRRSPCWMFGYVTDGRLPGACSRLLLFFNMHGALVTGLAARNTLRLIFLLSFVLWARTGAAEAGGINIALHAQSNYAMHGWVAGWWCIIERLNFSGKFHRWGKRTQSRVRCKFVNFSKCINM